MTVLLTTLLLIAYIYGLWRWTIKRSWSVARQEARIWRDGSKIAYGFNLTLELVASSVGSFFVYHLVVLLVGAIGAGLVYAVSEIEISSDTPIIVLLVAILVVLLFKRA